MDVSEMNSLADFHQLTQMLPLDVYFRFGRIGILTVPQEEQSMTIVSDDPDGKYARIDFLNPVHGETMLREKLLTHMITCPFMFLRSRTPLARGSVLVTSYIEVDVPFRHCLDVLNHQLLTIRFTALARPSQVTLREVLDRVGPSTKSIQFYRNTFGDEDRLEELFVAWATRFKTPDISILINLGDADVRQFLEFHLPAISDQRFYFPLTISMESVDAGETASLLLEQHGWKVSPIKMDRVNEYFHTIILQLHGISGSQRLIYIKPGYIHFFKSEFESLKCISTSWHTFFGP